MAVVGTTKPEPSETSQELKVKKNAFVFFNEETQLWEYFKCQLGDLRCNGKFIDMIITPPFLAEGYVSYGKDYYKVTIRDILRKKVHVSAKYSIPGRNRASRAAANNSTTTNPFRVEGTEGCRNESAASESDESRISEDANLAWKEQIRTLYHILDPEEGWDIQENLQP